MMGSTAQTDVRPPDVRLRHGRVDPVWWHAPTVLLRFPALFAGVAFGTLLLTLAAAAYPLFLSATTSELVRAAIERPNITRYFAGLTFTYSNLPLEPLELGGALRSPSVTDLDDPFRDLAAESPMLDAPIVSVLGETVTVSVAGRDETREGRLFASTGVLDHVEPVAGADGDGVWLPDLIADALGARPGDTIELEDAGGGTATVAVDGVYRAVYQTPLGGYWLQWQESFQVPCPDCSPLPQPILGDRDQVLALARELGQDSVTATWQAPLRDTTGMGLDDARALEAFGRRARQRVSDETGLGRLFNCCRGFFAFQRIGTNLTTSIGFAVKDASERITAVEGPSRVLEGAAIAVALVVVAAAGAFSIRTRRVEATWLFARGASPASVGAKSALEALLPCVVGALLGFAIAATAVASFGPDGRVEAGAMSDARLASIAAVAAAVALISVVSARAYAGVVDPHGRRFARLAARIPWELGLAGLAFLALERLREGGAFVGEVVGARKPSLALVAFPFLFVAAFSILGARIARSAFARLRRTTARSGAAPYLATRRLAASGALGVLLVAAAGLCLGTLLHAQTIARSLGTTVDAKAGVFVGADVAGGTNYRTPLPESFPLPMTRVVRFAAGARTMSGRPLDLLAVDARTLATAAYWHEGFSSDPLEEIAARLEASTGDRIPVVVAGGGGLTVDEVEIAAVDVPVRVVAEATAFPGMYSLNPTIVVDERTLLGLGDFPFDPLNDPRANTELWVRGGERAARDAFADMEFPPTSIVTAEEIKDIPYISAAINTFVVVNALGLVAGALTLVGTLMYLQARQRAQTVSYALSTRMGLRHGQHRRALALELGLMLGWAFTVGAVLALLAATWTVPYLDPISTIPPDPLLIVPVAVIALTGLVVAGFSWVGAAVTNRRARTVDLAEVMRVAE